jgi:hypothetical protein
MDGDPARLITLDLRAAILLRPLAAKVFWGQFVRPYSLEN